jgi:hypothetical protein
MMADTDKRIQRVNMVGHKQTFCVFCGVWHDGWLRGLDPKGKWECILDAQ